MNPLSIIASTFIAAGAVVMTLSILKFRSIVRMLKQFSVEVYGKLRLLFSFHEILMIFFLLGYLVVLYAILMNIKLVGDLFVGAIFFFGAIFVLLGIVLQSRMLAAIRKGYDELAGYRKHLERLVNIRTQELTNAKEEIKMRERYLESVLHNAPDAIVTLDANHRVIEWNPGAQQIF